MNIGEMLSAHNLTTRLSVMIFYLSANQKSGRAEQKCDLVEQSYVLAKRKADDKDVDWSDVGEQSCSLRGGRRVFTKV